MNLLATISFTAFPLLPVLVFLAELCVVTLSTLRVIFISRGMKLLAPMVGFFEVTIWLFAIGQVMQNLNDISCFLAFAGGFTLGNFFGLLIEQHLALGTSVVRTITNRDATELIEGLRLAQFGVTTLDAQGAKGPVKMLFTVVRRKELEGVLTLIRQFDPNAFYSVDEIQEAGSGIFPERKRMRRLLPTFFQLFCKIA